MTPDMPNPSEIVARLRDIAHGMNAVANQWALRAGADLIEQLRRELAAANARIEEARELLSHRDTQILWSDFPGSWCVRRNTWLSTPPVKVPTDPCVLHGVWPCRMCGTKHYAGCECFYCRSTPPAELTKTE